MYIFRTFQLIRYRIAQVGVWWIPILLIGVLDFLMHVRYKNRISKRIINFFDLLFVVLILLSSMVFSRRLLPREYWNSNYSFDIINAFKPGPGIYGFIDTWFEALLNILIFVPIGYMTTGLFKSKLTAVTLSSAFIITIELLQLSTNRGFFELSDILLNMSGVIIGCLYYESKLSSVVYSTTRQFFNKIWKMLQNWRNK